MGFQSAKEMTCSGCALRLGDRGSVDMKSHSTQSLSGQSGVRDPPQAPQLGDAASTDISDSDAHPRLGRSNPCESATDVQT